MRILNTLLPLLAVSLILLAGVVAADDTAALCPWYDEGAGLSIGGWNVDAGMTEQSSGTNGMVLGYTEMYQQTGERQQDQEIDPGDTVIDGQGYSASLNGQGSWQYRGSWNVTGNDLDFNRVLVVKNGRMNPAEEALMMNWVCPPSEVYSDNLTHPIGAMSAAAWNYADIFSGGYATQGSAGPGLLIADVAMAGNGLIARGAGYNAYVGIAKNVTENETQVIYSVIGNQTIATTVTVPVSQNVVVPLAHTTMHSWSIRSGEDLTYSSQFHYIATRSAPYESPA